MTKQPVNMKFGENSGPCRRPKSERDPLSLKQNAICLGGFGSSFLLSFLSVMERECHKASLIIFQKERKIFVSECWDDFWRICSKGCVIFSYRLAQVLESSFGRQCLSNNSLSFTCLFLKQLITLNAISLTYTRQESAFFFFFKPYQNVIPLEKKAFPL